MPSSPRFDSRLSGCLDYRLHDGEPPFTRAFPAARFQPPGLGSCAPDVAERAWWDPFVVLDR